MKLTVDIYYDAGKWEESKHPRDEEGRWTAGAYSAGAHKGRLAGVQAAAPLSKQEDAKLASKFEWKNIEKMDKGAAKIPSAKPVGIYERLKAANARPELLAHAKDPGELFRQLYMKYRVPIKLARGITAYEEGPETRRELKKVESDPVYKKAERDYNRERNAWTNSRIAAAPYTQALAAHGNETVLDPQQVKLMDEIFQKHSVQLPRTTLLYRGARLPKKVIEQLEQAQNTKKEVRFDHPEQRFVPTSTDFGKAKTYTKVDPLNHFDFGNEKGVPVMLEIVAQKGAAVLPTQSISRYKEVTLNRGSKFRVVSGSNPKGGLKTIRLELL